MLVPRMPTDDESRSIGSQKTIGMQDGEAEAPREREAGSLFAGRYVVERLLGRGGMGEVYLARDRLIGERVALKVLAVPAESAAQALEMLGSEVRLARKVTHPNVVRIHDLEEHAGQLFMTMEYVEGSDLRALLEAEGGRLSPSRAARIGRDVAEALAAAHAVGVVHRDIKPENILIERGGRVLLTDFGIARAHGAAQPEGRREAVVGTPAYMAPEQVASEPLGPYTDVYALGVVLFELVSGAQPFIGDGALQLAVARLTQQPRDVRTVAELPEPLAALIDACLRREPEGRPASGAQLADALDAFLTEAGPGPSSLPPTREPTLVRTPARTGKVTRGGAPLAPRQRALACLPFAYRGPESESWLGEAISGELIDVLARTRGLRVMSAGAVARVSHDRDPTRLAKELGVDFVVDGAVQLAQGRLRIVVRLVDAAGMQLSSDRFDIEWGDIFEVQERAGRRIAEALRMEISTAVSPDDVPREAIESYLRARRILRSGHFMKAAEAIAMLERALELAPGFPPAIAAHAHAAVQIWFMPNEAPARDWRKVAEESVARALELAPDVPDSQVAAARFASHRGDLRTAVLALRKALELAPTSPDAHNVLGLLECETGRADDGLRRLADAAEIEPSAGSFAYESARAAALAGDRARFLTHHAEYQRKDPGLASVHLTLRYGAWHRDVELLTTALAESARLGPVVSDVVATFARAFLGQADPGQAVSAAVPMLAVVNLRFGALIRQILVEVHVAAGDLDGAMDWLTELSQSLLYDLPWLERCGLLAPLRARQDFQAVLRDVRARCAAVWTT
jgi:serine/threonine-protein kinase